MKRPALTTATAVAVALCGLLTACAGPKAVQQTLLSSDLKAAYLSPDQTLAQARHAIVFEDGQRATSCNTYLPLIARVALAEGVNNQAIKSSYLECEALDLIAKAQPFAGNVDTASMGRLLLDRLDLRSFPNSLAMQATDQAFTLATLFPQNLKANGVSANMETADTRLNLQVVAVVPANGNASPDWIVQVANEFKTGNYRGYATLLLIDPLEKATVQGRSYP